MACFQTVSPDQPLDRDPVIQRAVENPPRRGVDVFPGLPVRVSYSLDAAGGRKPRVIFDEAAIGPFEADMTVTRPLDAEPTLVHQPVVMAAQ